MPTEIDVLIAGAGFSGIGMAIQLVRKMPHLSFLILEKSADSGGTWYENTYPGCACDIPSHLYSFSFELNPEWSRMFAPQLEIQAYLKRCAEKYDLPSRIKLNASATDAIWNESTARWHVIANTGEQFLARFFVSAIGALHIPSYPALPGLSNFAGPVFHSAQWDHSVPLEGMHVAVVGTGASSIQFVPQIAARVAKLSLFQRTPAWIVPRPDFAFSEKAKERFRRWPGAAWLFRLHVFWLLEIRVAGFLRAGAIRRFMAKVARQHLHRQIPDPALRTELTPSYDLGCKRVLVSSDFYPTLTRPNVELVREAINDVREHGIMTADGTEHKADVLIFATGFKIAEALSSIHIVGRDGLDLHEAWQERPSAFFGITVSGFPNFYLLLGPNTGLGHNSVVLMIEAQINYIISALKLLERRRKKFMVLRPGRQQRFLAALDRRLENTVWQSGGCRSWYQDQVTGKNIAIWPGSVIGYRWRTRSVSAADYDLRGEI
jgi:cation diffusion facilitator CzcD-associated flavoprotein CzcO